MDLIREILAAHESGISRDGLLAWARLRGDPKMTDEQLEQALVALGDEVVDVQGFLYLRANAPAGATSTPAAAASSGRAGATETPPPPPPPPGWAAAGPTPSSGWPAEAPPPAAPDGWTTSEPVPAGEADWASSEAQAWTTSQTGSRRSMIVAGVAVAGFVVIAAVASLLMRATDESTPVATPSSGTVIGAETLEVGDCVILPSEGTFDELRRLSCAEPHDGEIFFVGDHPEGDFPDQDGFETFVTASCEPAFAAYTGSSFYEQEVLDYGWFTPTEGSWQRGDREVSCYLTPTEGKTSRSWRNGNP